MTLTLEISNQSFCMTLRLMLMHHNTKLGMSERVERRFWRYYSDITRTHEQTDKSDKTDKSTNHMQQSNLLFMLDLERGGGSQIKFNEPGRPNMTRKVEILSVGEARKTMLGPTPIFISCFTVLCGKFRSSYMGRATACVAWTSTNLVTVISQEQHYPFLCCIFVRPDNGTAASVLDLGAVRTP